MQAAKLIIEVVAGVVPQQPMPEHTRRWVFTSADWDAVQGTDESARAAALDRWDQIHGTAREYAARLMNPRALNWVRLDWLWV